MKLPFAFATRLFFRLLLPGVVLSLFVYPAAERIMCWFNLRPDAELLFPLLSVALGWVISLADFPIYMFFEGRIMWPPGLFLLGLNRQAARLRKWQNKADFHHAEAQAYRTNACRTGISDTERDAALAKAKYHDLQRTEAALQVSQYPLNADRRREALFPTRLGNILAEHETYPNQKYGLDGVFYWYRIWVGLPKDLRDELDELQSLVDGVLYVMFSLILGAAILVVYWLIDNVSESGLLRSPWGDYWYSLCFLSIAISYGVYRISLPAQVQYGKFFKSLFDRFHSELNIQPVLDVISDTVGDPRVGLLKRREAYMTAWRYLQWDRFRSPGENKNRDVAEFTARASERTRI